MRKRVGLLTFPWWPSVAAASISVERGAALGMALAPSVLKVEAVSVTGRLGVGSGVVVADAKVITNCHVTRLAASVSVVGGGARHDVVREVFDVGRDLCLLDVPGLRAPVSPVATSDTLQPGQALVAVGYIGGVGPRFSGGDVVALHPHEGARVIQSSNSFTSGASGGGLFDTQGRLVGVLTFRVRADTLHQSDYYSAPAAWVQQLLQAPVGQYQSVQPLEGLAYWELPREQQVRFLRAGAANVAQDWPGLLALCEPWTKDEPSNPQAWGLLGTAYLRLGRREQSESALAQLQGIRGAQAWVQRLERDLETR
jgi:serine protease Do